ncbi:hypothetical protein SBA2_330012 [Acidobacteriia bacterium SbA2]|nr:hypothetical protein SBA2_330012 [Acidobacteriia bacterium SbA2]
MRRVPSLLFLQKFTVEEQAEFNVKYAEAKAETEAKYADTINEETRRFEIVIEAAKKARDIRQQKEQQRELTNFQRHMSDLVANETQSILKERFSYPIFLYDAEKVGITATGDSDQNELVPNNNQPPGITRTSLELYQEFRRDPKPFFIVETGK